MTKRCCIAICQLLCHRDPISSVGHPWSVVFGLMSTVHNLVDALCLLAVSCYQLVVCRPEISCYRSFSAVLQTVSCCPAHYKPIFLPLAFLPPVSFPLWAVLPDVSGRDRFHLSFQLSPVDAQCQPSFLLATFTGLRSAILPTSRLYRTLPAILVNVSCPGLCQLSWLMSAVLANVSCPGQCQLSWPMSAVLTNVSSTG